MKNPFSRFFKKPEPLKEEAKTQENVITLPTRPAPGGLVVHRHWTDDKKTDLTIIAVGGQVESGALRAISDILNGEAFVTHYGKKRKTPRLVGLTGSMGMI